MGISIKWNASQTDKTISSALKTLSARYPALAGGTGAVPVKFVKAPDGAPCTATHDGTSWTVSYSRPNMAVRMVGNIISGAIPAGGEECPFSTLGIMLDCSRNAVMTVGHLKCYLDHLAILGYNMVMLYTEDTYQIEGEPMFGFMRGAYSASEIREIDNYAASLGIEIVPCIQALGHLEQIFKWGKYADIRDRDGILLVDEDKTYALVEKMVAFWSANVRSRRIHLGMDEAHGLGTGEHERRFGKQSAFDIINRHLKRCCKICEKAGMRPMIWSDMYFRIGSKTNDYYDLESQPSQEVVSDIPKGLQLVYWDYYHENRDFYEKFIEKHRKMAGDPLMGSGVWTWDKFWYDHYYTLQTVVPCLEACRAKGLREVFFTMWGDRGGFCDYDSAFAGLAFAAELAFSGKANVKRLEKTMKALFGGSSYKAVTALGDVMRYNIPCILFDDPLMLLWLHSFWSAGEKWQQYSDSASFADVRDRLAAAAKAFSHAPDGDAGSASLGRALIKAACAKVAYAEAAFATLKLRDQRPHARKLLGLARKYEKAIADFYSEFHAMWHSHNKPFGFESIQVRLGGQVVRAGELVMRLEAFAKSGEKRIPEFDELARAGSAMDIGRWGSFLSVSQGTGIF